MNAMDVMRYGDRTLRETLARVPMEAWETGGVCGVWSVRQIIAHLTSYEALLIEVLGSVAGERAATPLLDNLVADWAGWNDAEVARRDGLASDETLAEYEQAHAAVMQRLERLAGDLLRQPGTMPWYGAPYAVDDFIVYQYYGHKREHSAQVAVFADTLVGVA